VRTHGVPLRAGTAAEPQLVLADEMGYCAPTPMPDKLPSPETVFAIVVLLALAAFRLVRWLRREASSPDPWGKEVDEALRREDTLPLCPHCLAPQERETWFCEECGSSIGAYNNLNPYLYAFSLGDLFRNGATGWARPRPLVVLGFVLLLPWGLFIWLQVSSIVFQVVGLACWLLYSIVFFRGLGAIPTRDASSSGPTHAPS
jgi:hypothetical protein